MVPWEVKPMAYNILIVDDSQTLWNLDNLCARSISYEAMEREITSECAMAVDLIAEGSGVKRR